ncbi:NAD(P)-binding protein [Rhizoclosmatium globosum]|uniref:NAD(P)-binding protein n=1 Tax=Rhizoclosmatium globosum TaxID=329046 RepID=A0A1Y2B0P4_9FUNG|nr:NAD(P)-binding protein [Rhizoclosmatium globosum]|eukprot:ORY28418.1 NAD(P)-binding protein [Rhizoclosmatium globosum]
MGITTFSASSEAEQVAKAFQSELEGKTILITGGNTGLGLETAKQLAGHGATVMLTARSETNGQSAIDAIKKAYPTATVVFYELDLASLKSVKAFAAQFLAHHTELNILINNAGVMACPKSFTTDGFETQFGVNHLGHFYLTQLLLPLLIKTATPASPSRIVTLSSGAQIFAPLEGILFEDLDAAKEYTPWARYGHSKLANRHIGITNIGEMAGLIFRRALGSGMFKERFKSIPEGASTTVLCALSPDVVKGGYYYDCKLSQGENMHPKATDADMATKLWDVSEKLIAQKIES